jgi:fructose/tagatose bisphosphate aldolase
MLLTPPEARKLFEYCIERGCGLLAINVDSPAAVYDCVKAAKESDAPIIIETSRRQLMGISFGAGDPLRGMALYLARIHILAGSDEFSDVPVVYHTDHIRGPDTGDILMRAIEGLGFTAGGCSVRLSPSSISLDASELTEDENITLICSLIETAKKCGRPLTIEMESGLDRGYTPPEEIERLVSGVERPYPGYIALFAPGLGTRHGYSREGYPDFRPELVKRNMDLLERLTGRRIGIVLHGSSGVSDDQIRQAVENGLTKMNVSTNATVIRSQAAQKYYEEKKERLVPGLDDFVRTASDNGVARYVSDRFVPEIQRLIRILGCAGEGSAFMRSLQKAQDKD